MLVLKHDRLNHLIEQLSDNHQYQKLSFEENRWELVWDEIYSTQGVVQSDVLEPVKNFADLLKKSALKNILDLGCGTGRNTIYMCNRGL